MISTLWHFRKAARALLLGGAALLASPSRPCAADIVFPPDKSLLDGTGPFLLLGHLKAGAGFTAKVTDASGVRAYPLGAGTVREQVLLSPGVNTIELPGRTISVYVAGAGAAPPPEGYSPPDPHSVDQDCGDCHAFTAEGAKLTEKVPALCAQCHDDVAKDKGGAAHAAAHPPVEEGDCLACHAFHGRSIKRLPAGERRDLCWGCHDDFTKGGTARMHRPVAAGDCAGCHLVHGAPAQKLLPETGLKLCLRCHKDPSRTAEGAEWQVPHPALDDGCPSCHLPHAAGNRGLLKKDQAPLCFDCHDSFLPPKGERASVHPPAEEGDCSGCHNPHGSNGRKLLRQEGAALCVTCHDDPAKAPNGQEWAVAHPALDDGCGGCHLPHTAPAPKLLKKDEAPLCFECHDAFPTSGADGKPLTLHRPVAQGRCGGCHAPHGSAEKKLLAAAPARALCLKCHKDPGQGPAGAPWAVGHAALDEGCPSCHLPHTAPAASLLTKPQGALCADCHDDKGVNEAGEPWATPHSPVEAGQCASCHRPHGSEEKALLPAPVIETCLKCHTTVHSNHLTVEIDAATGLPVRGRAVLPAGFPVRRKDGALACSGCHRPHGSDVPRLWTQEQTTFCGQCHRQY